MQWSASFGPDDNDHGTDTTGHAEDGFGEFVAAVAPQELPVERLRDLFGSFAAGPQRLSHLLAPAFPREWLSGERKTLVPGGAAEACLMQAVGLMSKEGGTSAAALQPGQHELAIVMNMKTTRVVWREEEDLTAADVCERAGLSVTDAVLVTGADVFVPMCQHASTLAAVGTLTAEPRLRFLLRRMPQLLENVAAAERREGRTWQAAVARATLEAWRVVLDSGTAPNERRDTPVALVSETTRMDGVRYVPGALLASGDLRGVAVFRKLIVLGVCKLAMLVQTLFSECSPHLIQIGKLVSGDVVQSVLLHQKPVFYRSLHEVLVEPDAAQIRARIDAQQLSATLVSSLLCDMASCRPSSVTVFLLDGGDSFGVEIGPEALDTALQPYATSTDRRGEEQASVCNVLWMLEEEMGRAVHPLVRSFWLSLDPENAVLRLLEKCSVFNDQLWELFKPEEMQTASGTSFVPLLVRTGVGTNLLNKAVLIQSILRRNEATTHTDLFRALLPELFVLYQEASRRARGNVLDAWRLVTRRSHTVNEDGISVPEFKANFKERAQLICGDELAGTAPVSRLVLRRAIEREMGAVKLVAEVLKAGQDQRGD